MAKVKVILCSKIKKYGNPGDIAKVAMGYARYLVNIKSAFYAISENIEYVKSNLNDIIRNDEEKLNKFKAIANKITDLQEIKIIKKANNNGKLHGSVNESIIVELLEKKGITISKTNVNSFLAKFVGDHTVKFQFKGGISTELKIIIEREKDEEDEIIEKNNEKDNKNNEKNNEKDNKNTTTNEKDASKK